MRTLLAAGALAVSLLAATAMSATAGDTEVSFEVTAAAGGLSISHATSTASLSASGFALTDADVTGTLPATTVTDVRGQLGASWTVTVSGEDFVHGTDAGQTVAATNARVYLDAADVAGLTTALGGALTGMAITDAEFNTGTSDLGTPYTLIVGTTASIAGDAEVTYTPTINVTVPGGTPAGTYSATVTQTAS